MTLCTYTKLHQLIENGLLEGVPLENINGASVDLTLADTLWIEDQGASGNVVDLAAKETPTLQKIVMHPEGHYDLMPGEFCLAASREVFDVPLHVGGKFLVKSSLARSGLNHLLAGWIDPGWHGSALTLELHNCLRHHALRLRPGMKIGQAVFWAGDPVPLDKSYQVRGQYNLDREAQPSKGVR